MELTYNLHMHSCLSPCGSDDMTPDDAVAMCALCGYGAVALTDHNTAANTPTAAMAARKHGLVFLPGLELTTREDIHVICLFAEVEDALAFSGYVHDRLPNIQNRPEVGGRQVITDARGRETGTLDKWLGAYADIGIYEVTGLMVRFNGLAFPAHVDRPSFSLLSVLGAFDDTLGFTLAEVTAYAPDEFTSPLPLIVNSDAHDLASIPDAERTITVRERSAQGVLDALRGLRISEKERKTP